VTLLTFKRPLVLMNQKTIRSILFWRTKYANFFWRDYLAFGSDFWKNL